MKVFPFSLLALSLLAARGLLAAPDAELVAEGNELAPTATFEVRFAREMVAADQLGVPVTPSPVLVTPELAGTFTWLSRRSGVFTPTQEPAMGATFTISLVPSLKDAAGKPVTAKTLGKLKTPAFGVVQGIAEEKKEAAAPKPQVELVFNREVNLEGAEKFFRFVESKGKSIAAEVSYTETASSEESPEPWEKRWQAGQAPLKPRVEDKNEEEGRPQPRPNCLTIEPVLPLTPGTVWRLEIKSGLPASTGGYTLARTQTSYVGRVEPFTLTTVTTASNLQDGRSVQLKFSRSPSEVIRSGMGARFFKLTPEVQGLRFEADFEGLTIRGDFQRELEYRLETSPELCDSAGLPLEGARVRTLRFGPMTPRVYLPATDVCQMAGGQRKFPFATVNMKSLHVVARLVPPSETAQALTAFKEFESLSNRQEGDEEPRPLDPETIPGEKIYDRVLSFTEPKLDVRQETKLDWTELLGGAKPGMVFLSVEGQPSVQTKEPPAAAQALVQLTDLGVLWQKAGGELKLSVFSMATGKPAVGAQLTLLDEQFATAGQAATDAMGAATLPITEDLAWLTVRLGEDVLTLRMGSDASELPMGVFHLSDNYDSWDAPAAKTERLRALLFTDRPLYRPGETVHVKGMTRSLGDTGLQFFASRKGTLKVYGPHDRGSSEIAVETDEHGGFAIDLPLDPAVRGEYHLSLSMGERASIDSGDASFIAADYQPNAFEVTVAAPARFGPDASISVDARARYFFGAALGKAHAQWTLRYSDSSFSSEDFVGFTFTGSPEEEKKLTLHGESELSPGGTLAIKPQLPAAAGPPKLGELTVEITDENQQTVSAQTSFQRDSSIFYLGLKLSDDNPIKKTESIGAIAVALRPDGAPMPAPIIVKAELIREFYELVRAPAPAVSFRTEPREEVVETVEAKTLVPVRVRDRWALPPGETARFRPGRDGDYKIRLTAQDDGGRTVLTEVGFSVSDSERPGWESHQPEQVELVADKTEYHPGDTAHLRVKNAFSGEALVNVERGERILRTLRLPLQGDAPVLEIPIVAGDAPNVFVSMITLHSAADSTLPDKAPEFRYGVCELRVSQPETALALQITPRTPEVEPGQETVTEIVVTEADGRPAAGAEVTFFAVDNGVLGIADYERPMPREIFERPFSLEVRTGLTLFDLLTDSGLSRALAARRGFDLKSPASPAEDEPAGPRLRTNFPGTAIWEPKLIADARGKVVVKFKAPDAITSYRLVAVAQAGTNRFGSAESHFQVSKRLILFSGLGQFAHTGDTLIARAVLRNESTAAGTAKVALELDATAEPPAQPLTASVALQPGEAQTVDFPVKLRAPGPAQWKWTATMNVNGETLTDGLLASLQVTSPAPILRETYLPELPAEKNDLLAGVNPQLLEGTGSVQVTLSNTRLASLRESSRALLEYPYGCAEQTVSAMIPWIVARDFGTLMPELADAKTARAALDRGLEKLATMKIREGGLAYWPGGREPDLFATAYAVLGLSLVAKHADDPPDELEPLATWLGEQITKLNERGARLPFDDAALAAYALALAGQADSALEEQLYGAMAKLTGEGRALLACAMMEEEKYDADRVAKLLDPSLRAPECLCWFGSATRERAIRLLAWAKFKPKDPLVAPMTQELLAARAHGAWRTTQENVWALLALSRYFTTIEGEVKPVSGTLAHDGTSADTFSLTPQKLTSASRFDFTTAQGLGALTVTNPQQAPLYGQLSFAVEPPVAVQPRQDRGYSVARSYFKLVGDGSLQEAKDLVVGDRVVVVLRLESAAPGHFVALDDPLPAILEAVNPDFKSQAGGAAAALERDWLADYREVRADRVLYFCDHLPAGTHTFRYLARVRSAGLALAPSTKVEEMYRPERFGLAAGSTLESRAR